MAKMSKTPRGVQPMLDDFEEQKRLMNGQAAARTNAVRQNFSSTQSAVGPTMDMPLVPRRAKDPKGREDVSIEVATMQGGPDAAIGEVAFADMSGVADAKMPPRTKFGASPLKSGRIQDPFDKSYEYKLLDSGSYAVFRNGQRTATAKPGTSAYRSIASVAKGGPPIPASAPAPKAEQVVPEPAEIAPKVAEVAPEPEPQPVRPAKVTTAEQPPLADRAMDPRRLEAMKPNDEKLLAELRGFAATEEKAQALLAFIRNMQGAKPSNA